MGWHGLTAGVTLFSNRTSTFCWFNCGMHLIMEMIKNENIQNQSYNDIPDEDKDMISADFSLPDIVSALVFRDSGTKVSYKRWSLLTFYSTHAIMYVLPKVNPEPIIKKVAMTYLGVHPYVLYLFMREQQEIETFLEIFLQSESLLLL